MSDTSYGFDITNKMNHLTANSSSENESIRNEMSYLYGRDPSILAYGQRPFPSQDSKKNLYSLLEEEQNDKDSIQSTDTLSAVSSSILDPAPNQTIKVFLRMKPFPKKMMLTNEQMETYKIINSTTLMTKLPSLDSNTSCLKRIKTNEMVCRNFIFTQTFDAETSQKELFENAVEPQMINFLAGNNSIVMSYGTTNSGKTYTLQGTPESPGIIPRGIDFVFSHVNPQAIPCFKPINCCDIIYLNNQERSQESDIKMKLLTLNQGDKNLYVTTYNQMQRLLVQESPMRPEHCNDAQYSVWISFAEIYNEVIYDLLRTDCQKKRPALKLAVDSKGRTFIKGLRSICVSSGAEAYQVLMAGQYNLKVAATALNSRSSRSHCIFTIKLLKYTNELDPNRVSVSMFAFCDLAGSERLKKTLNVGERLKEAQNINTSLLVLGRCLKAIYESQTSRQKNDSIGPFRDSKLTRLFQHALSGKEQIALIVNVNPVPNLYIETQNVLNFSAIAKKIVIKPTNVIKRRHSHSRFSRLVSQNLKTEMDWENTELEDESVPPDAEENLDVDENDQEDYEELLTENEMLKTENKELKESILIREMQTRQEMTDVYSKIMKTLEENWKNRYTDLEEQQEDLRNQIEEYYREKLQRINNRKRSRTSRGDEDDEDDDDDNVNEKRYIKDLEAQNTKYVAKIETLKKLVKDLSQTKEVVETEKMRMSFDLAMAKEEVKRVNKNLELLQVAVKADDPSAEYINQLQDEIAIKDDRIKKMKVFLNEAKEEYITISNHAQKMEEQIKEQEEHLAEDAENINDLKEQLSQATSNSSAQNKVIEHLEEELEQQAKKLFEAEKKIKELSKQLLTASFLHNKKDTVLANDEGYDEDDNIEKKTIESLELRFELSEKEKIQLQEKLDRIVKENELLKNNLDLTKSQLCEVTEKIATLSIEKSKQKKYFTTEQEIQTEANKSFVDEQIERKFENISCQTTALENSTVETDEKWQQTSAYLNESHGKEEIISEQNLIIKTNKEAYSDLEKQFKELKINLENCKIEKFETQKQFEENLKELQNQISKLNDQVEEKNTIITKMQQESQVIQNSKDESNNLKELALEQELQCKELTLKVEELQRKEYDKDMEIKSLQLEIKTLIRSNEETTSKMEVEIKTILTELSSYQEKLVNSETKNVKMDKEYREVMRILENKIGTLESSSMEKQLEIEKLKQRVEEMKKALFESHQQLEVFEKNREKNMAQYEDVIMARDEELNRLRAEIQKLQELLQEVKENTSNTNVCKSVKKSTRKPKKPTVVADENTSEDDHIGVCDSKSKKALLTPKVENSVSELSGSESNNAPGRVTRRRKLFVAMDQSFVDIEPSDPTPPIKVNARSLRRRK